MCSCNTSDLISLKFRLFMLLKIHPGPCHLYVDWGQRNLSRLVYCQRDAYYTINHDDFHVAARFHTHGCVLIACISEHDLS